ncbi:SIR2 family protein [Deefgea tanakiae]|uniref:SIR2 family protein n=1 Tax=Deefgea tanakiae TaxID=2865840 RepID=A0ABX8Z4R7_9NEIS|nr:SIR2 family protein [Deefgea tanakiae]QZA76379.1 SIR2 family protein [Deefgea tanakiae]
MTKISDLSDYPAIKKLASALHKFDASQHGAAIMIGAGFSRSAACHVGGEKKMSLWNDFSKKLVAELSPNDKNHSFSDPLRVAEEYRAYFGQAALNDRVRSEIDDEAWRTGALYQSLLELPWSEIMTTNWDTLLERACKDVHGPYYTPVTKPADLSWAPSPRIVKLHGTIGITDTFIAAQEDYRTYPAKFAPFINFARQVFIENELCLLGFSGDDPNFLQWAGWVRDQLADHARKIYLVGALNLTAAQRKYLESINVAPIDLWDLVKHIDDRDLRHQNATESFLLAMKDEGCSKTTPHEWSPSNLHRSQVTSDDHTRTYKEHEYAATLLKGQLDALKSDRESYPGWLVCPPALQWQIRSQLCDPYPSANNIAALDEADRAKLVYEIAWRYNITFEYIAPWLMETLFQFANPDQPCAISKRQQLEIALLLLKNSRWLNADDDAGKAVVQERIHALISVLEKHAQYLPDAGAELAYHRALVARDALNYAGMEVELGKIIGEDPIWKVRQAALLMALGRFDEGTQLISKAYGELRESYRRDRNSISTLSRLTWVHWLLKSARSARFDQEGTEKLPAFAESVYRKWRCDPWRWIEEIQEKLRKRQEEFIKKQNPIEPSFTQGHYRDNSNQYSISNETAEFFLMEGLTRSVGIPLRSGRALINVDLLAWAVEKLMLSGGVGIELWNYTLAIRAANSETSPTIKDFFTRIGVARASKDVVDILIDRILIAIDYWRKLRGNGTDEQQDHALSVLLVLIEVLARLAIRVPTEKAKEIFRLALSLGQQSNLQHFWLFEVIGSLLTHSLISIPAIDQGGLLANTLVFPLALEVPTSDGDRWPNPVIHHINERNDCPGLEKRIGELINAVATDESTSSSAAILRLLPLVEKEGFLTQLEQTKLADAIWGSKPEYQLLPNVANLYPHAYLLLPSEDNAQVRSLIYRYLYEHNEDILTDTQKELRSYPSPEIQRAVLILSGMVNAAVNVKTHLFPTPEQALILFDRLVQWRPFKVDTDYLGAARNNQKQLAESIGNALSSAIAPALSSEAKTNQRFEQLQAFYSQIDEAITALPALIYFTEIDEQIAYSVEKNIKKALQSSDAVAVIYAAFALQKWMGQSGAATSLQLKSLISRLIVIIESGRMVGLQQLLWISGELYKEQFLSAEQVATLTEAIPDVFNAATYANIDPKSREAVNSSSIREACVKLAKILVGQLPENPALQALLAEASVDALPEVRFAIDSIKEF